MSVNQIIDQINNLPSREQSEIYNYVLDKARRKEHAIKSLEKLKGIGKGLWDKDAQEYITEMRSDARF